MFAVGFAQVVPVQPTSFQGTRTVRCIVGSARAPAQSFRVCAVDGEGTETTRLLAMRISEEELTLLYKLRFARTRTSSFLEAWPWKSSVASTCCGSGIIGR